MTRPPRKSPLFPSTPLSRSPPKTPRRQVAKAVGMSEDYLSRLFNRELGLSPWDYLNRLRIQHAKERPRESDDSIQVVARRVGFHDRAYFSRTFRKLTGLSPQAFRESPRF